MSALICGCPDEDSLGVGYIIRHHDLVRPVVESCPSKYYGMSGDHTLFVLAMDIRYKFKCEDFEDKFQDTAKFIKAKIQKNHKYTVLFKSKERKLLDTNPKDFFLLFKETLEKDLNSYYGSYGKNLAEKMKKEIDKISYE